LGLRLVTSLVAAMVVAGFGLTLAVFYPGLMPIDAGFIHRDTIEGFRGDWQSPVMTALWALIDPIAPPERDRYKSTHCLV
jgi:hypothetical protein